MTYIAGARRGCRLAPVYATILPNMAVKLGHLHLEEPLGAFKEPARKSRRLFLLLPCSPRRTPQVFGYMSQSATHCLTNDPRSPAQLSLWPYQEHAKRSRRPCLLRVPSNPAGNGVTKSARTTTPRHRPCFNSQKARVRCLVMSRGEALRKLNGTILELHKAIGSLYGRWIHTSRLKSPSK